MKKAFLLIIVMLAAVQTAAAADRAETSPGVSTRQDAMDYCDRETLMPLEGLWEFPDDETQVFIRRADAKGYRYDIFVIASPDCRLQPGERLGAVEASTDASKFRISLFCNRSGDILTDTRNCLGIFNSRQGTLSIEPRKYKISLRSISFLPRFWRMVRVRRSDPLEKLPRGLIRLYPSYDGNGSSPLRPRYL